MVSNYPNREYSYSLSTINISLFKFILEVMDTITISEILVLPQYDYK